MENDSNDSSPGGETRVEEVNEEERSVESGEQEADEQASQQSGSGSEEKEQEEAEEQEADEGENEQVEEEDDAEKPADEEAEKDSDDEEFAGFEEEDISSKAKKRQIVSDSDDSDAEEKEAEPRAEDSDNDEDVVNEEDEEDHKRSKKKKHKKHHDENQDSNSAGHTDLEKALAKQKAENRKRHRKKNMDSEEITDVENTVAAIITEMKNVAMDDRVANEKSSPAIQKLKLLPTVVDFLKKSDYHATMIEMGILGAMAEWMAPLPDKSLPNIKIREELIDALKDFGEINADYLKSSGVGKAVMFLYKHPKEIKGNKQKLEKLIHNWSRPIFNLDSNFKHLTKEERMQRDMEHVKTLNRRNSDETGERARVDDFLAESSKSKRQSRQHREDKSDSEDPNKLLRPGDPGFIPRARVPVPSAKDYIIRPKSNVDSMEITQKTKKSESRIDKHTKKFLEIKKSGRFQRAVTMKIGGKD